MTNGEKAGNQIVPIPPGPQGPPGIGFQQVTQIAPQIPASVWTTEALMDFHARNEKILLDNNERQERIATNNNSVAVAQRKREHIVNMSFLLLVAVIVFAGLWFMYKGISGGKEIILGAGSFAAGVLAGRGTK